MNIPMFTPIPIPMGRKKQFMPIPMIIWRGMTMFISIDMILFSVL